MGENRRLRELDAVAAERGLILAFRACDESDGYEPVASALTVPASIRWTRSR